MKVWLYVFLGCILASVCRCDGDAISEDHDLNRRSGCWYVCSVNLNSVGERTPPYGTPVLN